MARAGENPATLSCRFSPPPHTGLAARPGTQCTLGMRGVAAVNARTQGAAEALFAGKSACGLLGFDSTLRMRSVLMMRTKPRVRDALAGAASSATLQQFKRHLEYAERLDDADEAAVVLGRLRAGLVAHLAY